MPVIGIAVVLLVLPFLVEYGFRVFVSRRIATAIETAPPLALIESTIPEEKTSDFIVNRNGLEVGISLFAPQSGRPRGLVFFCPELDGNQWSVPLYCKALIEAGFTVVGIGFDSLKTVQFTPSHWPTTAELELIDDVIRDVTSRPAYQSLPVGIFGISRGGNMALLAASRNAKISCVATDSGYSSRKLMDRFVSRFGPHVIPEKLFERLPDWHIRRAMDRALSINERRRGYRYLHLEDVVHDLNQPVLMIFGRRDSYVNKEVAETVAGLIGDNAETWFVPRAKHNQSRQVAAQEYSMRLVEHFYRMQSVTQKPLDYESIESNVA